MTMNPQIINTLGENSQQEQNTRPHLNPVSPPVSKNSKNKQQHCKNAPTTTWHSRRHYRPLNTPRITKPSTDQRRRALQNNNGCGNGGRWRLQRRPCRDDRASRWRPEQQLKERARRTISVATPADCVVQEQTVGSSIRPAREDAGTSSARASGQSTLRSRRA